MIIKYSHLVVTYCRKIFGLFDIIGVFCGKINSMRKLLFNNLKETEEFGKSFAQSLEPGSVIALIGTLGAGKTTLTKAIAKGLGVTEMLSSPTFTIVCEYETGRIPLFHFDVYRVNDPDELFEMGFEEYFDKGGVCLIEWADLIEDLLPENTITLKLYYGETEDSRILEIYD